MNNQTAIQLLKYIIDANTNKDSGTSSSGGDESGGSIVITQHGGSVEIPPQTDSKKEEVKTLLSDEDQVALLPKEIVKELDKFIIGQADAKRAVAVALRNRWRRRNLPKDMADEIIPKNILMIGPTGVGKTEIARRLAKLAQAPFIKVEATKFTEVGFHGRDVDMIVKDLVEIAIHDVTAKEKLRVKEKNQRRSGRKNIRFITWKCSTTRTKRIF